MTDRCIYESPDGGHTVYVREAGSDERKLHHISEQRTTLIADLQKQKLWGEIHRAAKKDSVLQDMLYQIEIYHQLKNSP